MTAQQCAERQAARDNLVQELVDALERLLRSAGTRDWLDEAAVARIVLARAKEKA